MPLLSTRGHLHMAGRVPQPRLAAVLAQPCPQRNLGSVRYTLPSQHRPAPPVHASPIFCGEDHREKGREEEATGTPNWSRSCWRSWRACRCRSAAVLWQGRQARTHLACMQPQEINGTTQLATPTWPWQQLQEAWKPGQPASPHLEGRCPAWLWLATTWPAAASCSAVVPACAFRWKAEASTDLAGEDLPSSRACGKRQQWISDTLCCLKLQAHVAATVAAAATGEPIE